jgi:hypothetical protein
MIQRRSIFSLLLCTAVALPALANPARYAITAGQVAAAVANQGMQVSPDQVVLLTGVVANVAAPELKVKSIDRMGPERAIARLECADSEQCLPFVVSIRLSANESADPVVAPSHFLQRASLQSRPAPIAVRAGSTVILLLDGPHVHISLTVICLENGAPGQTIRATDRDHRQFYMARVTQDGFLEGRL